MFERKEKDLKDIDAKYFVEYKVISWIGQYIAGLRAELSSCTIVQPVVEHKATP